MPFGPIELVVLRFPTDQLKGQVSSAVADLVNAGTIRILDLLIAQHQDGGVTVVNLESSDQEALRELQPSPSELSNTLTEEDARTFAGNLPPGNTVAVLLFENTWAGRLAGAISDAHGEVVAHEPIPRAVVEQLIAGEEGDQA